MGKRYRGNLPEWSKIRDSGLVDRSSGVKELSQEDKERIAKEHGYILAKDGEKKPCRA